VKNSEEKIREMTHVEKNLFLPKNGQAGRFDYHERDLKIFVRKN
jgi:hypothetical protein